MSAASLLNVRYTKITKITQDYLKRVYQEDQLYRALCQIRKKTFALERKFWRQIIVTDFVMSFPDMPTRKIC